MIKTSCSDNINYPNFCQLAANNEDQFKKFRTHADYTESRIDMYKCQKMHSSQLILPDPKSLLQHLKRVNYQVYIWLQCMEREINYSYGGSLKDIGWISDNGEVYPLWYTEPRFPPESSDDGMSDNADNSDLEDGSDEGSDSWDDTDSDIGGTSQTTNMDSEDSD